MSEAPSRLPPPPNPALARVLATITYLAALIALWGFTSLLLDRDVIVQSDAGPLLGPAMALAACVATWLSLARSGRMALWVRALASAVFAFAGMLLVGAVGYALSTGEPGWLLLFVANYAASPFVIGAALLSGVTVLLAAAFTRQERQ